MLVVLTFGGAVSRAAAASGTEAIIAVFRPENNGSMNIIPCTLLVDKTMDVLSAKRTRFDDGTQTQIKLPAKIRLIGGEMVALVVRPGQYSLRVDTPISEQLPGYRSRPERTWRSNLLAVTVTAECGARVSVIPAGSGSTYNGGWRLRLTTPDWEPTPFQE